jgi:hypothetical protein
VPTSGIPTVPEPAAKAGPELPSGSGTPIEAATPAGVGTSSDDETRPGKTEVAGAGRLSGGDAAGLNGAPDLRGEPRRTREDNPGRRRADEARATDLGPNQNAMPRAAEPPAPRRLASLADAEAGMPRAGRRAADTGETPLRPGDVNLVQLAFWDEEAINHFRSQWHEVKADFVDDPVAALTRAHDLLTDAVNELTESLLA